ncbi:MAG: ABC transporter permease, partial [Gammaproteobacteria bacterium]|nr:ABC transporter permease [Gammaproteobacteria bacterium]
MARRSTGVTRRLLAVWAGCVVVFMYLPVACVVLASFSRNRYFRFPIPDYDTKWYERAFSSLSVQELFQTSLSIALLVTVISVVLA